MEGEENTMIEQLKNDVDVPLYQQLFLSLQNRIDSGEWLPGSKIPTEQELCDEYDVSRITVRKAVTELVRSGFLVKHQGKGTFVVERAKPPKKALMNNYSSMCRAEGRTPGAQFLGLEIVVPNEKERAFFGSENLKNVFRLRRLRTADGIPVALENLTFPSSFSFLLDADFSRSMFDILIENGQIPERFQREISICSANDEEHRLLNVPLHSPLLLVDETLRGEGEAPIYMAHNIICGESFHLMVV